MSRSSSVRAPFVFRPSLAALMLMAAGMVSADPVANATAGEAERRAPVVRRPGLDPRAVDRWLAWVRERRPAEYERLTRLRAERPAEFEAEAARRLGEWARVAADREGPAAGPTAEQRMEQYSARIESIARAYRDAPAEQRPVLRQELQQLVTIAFDLQEAERRERLGRLEREVQRLKRELEQRRAAREQMIERKVREILEADTAAR